MKPVLFFAGIIIALLILTGCGPQLNTFTEKSFIIASKETIKVPELSLSVTNNGCGREWVSEEGKPGYERTYCGLVIKYRDSTLHAGKNSEPVYIGNVKIQLDKMNPWGREEDSIPPGGCRIIITKLSDISR